MVDPYLGSYKIRRENYSLYIAQSSLEQGLIGYNLSNICPFGIIAT